MKKIIEIADVEISFDLVNGSYFDNLDKYETDRKPKYFIKSRISKFEIPKDKYKETKYYDLYDNGNVQIQRNDNGVIGKIVYSNNLIDIFLLNDNYVDEYLLTQYALAYIIEKESNMVFMHGSSICYRNDAYIFTAPSNTGKSTHTSMWIKYSDAIHINDDKNIIALKNDNLFVYPNPWSGKHKRDNNIKAPLKAVIFIEQSKTNEVLRPNKKESALLLLKQLLLPKGENKESFERVFDKLLDIPTYVLKCNMEKEAFEIINNIIEGDIYGNNK